MQLERLRALEMSLGRSAGRSCFVASANCGRQVSEGQVYKDVPESGPGSGFEGRRLQGGAGNRWL
jgi:hypothetical protein